MGEFAALTLWGGAAVSAEAKASPIEGPSAYKVEGALAAYVRCKTVSGDGSAALTPDGAVAVFADTAAAPVEECRV